MLARTTLISVNGQQLKRAMVVTCNKWLMYLHNT